MRQRLEKTILLIKWFSETADFHIKVSVRFSLWYSWIERSGWQITLCRLIEGNQTKMAIQWRIMDITTALLTREIGCCCCAWGRTCFSDLRFSFDLVNVFFIFFALQSLCSVSFFLSSSICAWYLSFYRVIQVCACVFFFSFLWLFVTFYIALYLCLHETTSLIFLIDL